MCGRFTLTAPGEDLAEAFGLDDVPSLAPRYNVAPTQPVGVVRMASGAGRLWGLLRWGLRAAPDLESRSRGPLINARAESAASRPAFREAFRLRRCLIPADGFYEWTAEMGRRQPYYVRMRDGKPFALAGLWEPGTASDAQGSCTILTTEPNDVVRPLHDRMPVILAPEDYDGWLDHDLRSPGALRPLLRPFPAGPMTAYAVGRAVNDPKNDSPECVRPL